MSLFRCGQYVASFDCATRIASVLGNRKLSDNGDEIPVYKIPIEEMYSACQKLAERFSIALVDMICEKQNSRFVCVWKITPAKGIQPTLSLDEY